MIGKMVETDVAIVGAGGCGLTAALIVAEQGKRVVLLERNATVGGSTAMSAGIFVAAGSRLQQANDETGTPEELAADIFQLNGRILGASSVPGKTSEVKINGKVDRYAPVTIQGKSNLLVDEVT